MFYREIDTLLCETYFEECLRTLFTGFIGMAPREDAVKRPLENVWVFGLGPYENGEQDYFIRNR